MARMTRMAHTVARMARWLADLADPSHTCKSQVQNVSRMSLVNIEYDF